MGRGREPGNVIGGKWAGERKLLHQPECPSVDKRRVGKKDKRGKNIDYCEEDLLGKNIR